LNAIAFPYLFDFHHLSLFEEGWRKKWTTSLIDNYGIFSNIKKEKR